MRSRLVRKAKMLTNDNKKPAVCFLFFSTIFLMGPMNQLKKMFETTRLIATIVFLVSNVRHYTLPFNRRESLIILEGFEFRLTVQLLQFCSDV